MTEQRYLRIMIKWWWLAAAAALLAGVAAYRYTLSQPTLYEASARLIIGPGIESPSPDTNTLRASGQLIQTYAELPKTGPFLQGVIERLGLDLSPDELASAISVETNAETQIMTIRVQDRSRDQAVAIANQVVDRLVELSPSGSGSEQAQLYDQIRVQIANLERTIAATEARIAKLEADLQAYQGTGTAPGGPLLSQDEELNRLLLQFQEGAGARERRIASEQILAHLLSNTSDRIASLEAALQGTDNLGMRQLILKEIAAERSHLSGSQSTVAELKRPVDGLPLETYLDNLRTKIAALENQLQNTVGTDARRLVDDQINQERERLSEALQIEVARQQLVLDRVAAERDRVSGLEGLDVEIQSQTQAQIDLERGRLTEQQRTLSSLYQPLQETMANQAEVIERAESASPAPSQRELYILLGALAGLILSLVIVFAFETWSDKVESAEDLAAAGGAPVLGKAPTPPFNLERGASPLVVVRAPDSPAARGYRMLAARLLFANSSASLRTLLVASPHSAREAGLSAANLAAVLAAAGRRVVLVDADPDGPTAARFFGPQEGSAEASVPWPAAGFPGLSVYRNGPQEDFSLLSPDRLAQALAGFEARADFVLVTSPALDRVESLVLASQVGAVLLVVSANRISRGALGELAGSLRSAGANLLGYLLRYNPPLYSRLFELAGGLARKGFERLKAQVLQFRSLPRPARAELLAGTGLPAPEPVVENEAAQAQIETLEAQHGAGQPQFEVSEAQNGAAPEPETRNEAAQAQIETLEAQHGAAPEPEARDGAVQEQLEAPEARNGAVQPQFEASEAQNGAAPEPEAQHEAAQAPIETLEAHNGAAPAQSETPEDQGAAARPQGRSRAKKRSKQARPSASELPSQLEP